MSLPDSKAAIREVVVGSRRIKNWEERFNYIAKKWGKKDGNRMAASLFSLIEKGKGIMRIISINQTTFFCPFSSIKKETINYVFHNKDYF